MAPKSKRKCIADALENLEPEDLEKFRRQFLDRKVVNRNKVHGKNFLELADVLVSTYTEDRAVKVTKELLKEIGCLDVAKEFEQKTKALLNKGGCKRKTKLTTSKVKPSTSKAKSSSTKVKPSTSKVKPSISKVKSSTSKAKSSSTKAKPSTSKAKSSSTKAKPPSTKKSLNTINFGQHEGKTFKWLLKNDMDYTAYIVASHQNELEGATGSKMPKTQQHMANKDALTKYVSAYPEVLEEVRFHRAYEKSREAALKTGQKGKVLVGIRPYRWETLKELYESKDPQKISYVDFLRKKKSTCDPGSKMEIAINYILQRDKAKAAATKRQTTSGTGQKLTVKRTNGQCVQSNSTQPTNDSGPIRKKQKRS